MSDKERSEEIQKLWQDDNQYYDPCTYEWFMEQFEQKQALETTIDFYQSVLRDADWQVEKLESELERVQELEEDYEYLSHHYCLETEQNKRYREALEFYENPYNWQDGLVSMDAGEIARQALEES